jgi:hypothetical protein
VRAGSRKPQHGKTRKLMTAQTAKASFFMDKESRILATWHQSHKAQVWAETGTAMDLHITCSAYASGWEASRLSRSNTMARRLRPNATHRSLLTRSAVLMHCQSHHRFSLGFWATQLS